MTLDLVDLSRLQFAFTAIVHFLFVPLTLGLSALIAIMETVYVMTGRDIWKKMTQYWGVLFGINFAMGVATGITMEFQFGTNWGYYSHYVGDIFGVPLAIEGLMAFFLEATFIGLFFFGWNKISKVQHLVVTWLVALGTNFSALWILIANGWMQNPVGAYFEPETMRMQVKSFYEVFFNPVAQAKFVHTVSAGYVTGSIFVLAISSYFLLRGRNVHFAKRSMTVAASFGLAAALSVVVLGDESGYVANENQKMKIAAVEAMWDTEKAPAGLTVFGITDQKHLKTHYEVKVPYLLGLIATRSFDGELKGIKDLVTDTKTRIKRGVIAYRYLKELRKEPKNSDNEKIFRLYENDLGYGLLLKKYTSDLDLVTDEMIDKAAWDTVPHVAPMFWGFRVMAGLGFFFIALLAYGFYLASIRQITKRPRYHKLLLWSLPLPWIAIEFGWFIAEYGRQPWVIEGILPTRLAVSTHSATEVLLSLSAFVVFYLFLTCVELFLMVKYVRLGPDGMKLIGEKA